MSLRRTVRAGGHTDTMAERLAQVTLDAPVTSRPEQSRSHRWRWPRRVAVTAVSLVLVASAVVTTLHFLSIERRAEELRATSLVPLGMPSRVLVVLGRPGQELTMAGTLAALQDAGSEVALLAMTSELGAPPKEAGTAPADVVPSEALRASAARLGLDEVAVAGYPTGELMRAEPALVTRRIARAVADWRPSAILTVTDGTGSDQDSQAVAGYTIVAAGTRGSGVTRVWTATRGQWERAWQALAGGVPRDHRLPTAQAAVRLTDPTAQAKADVLATYSAEQPQVTASAYPASDTVPASLYLRFWDREYFALAWGEPIG